MRNPTEQNVVNFFKRLNKIDNQDKSHFLRVYVCMAISGGVVGFIFGYFVGATIWS